jgi:hypothetical protein
VVYHIRKAPDLVPLQFELSRWPRVLCAVSVLLAAALPLVPSSPGSAALEADWRLNPYPEGHRFAFTIVQDADSAYSRRLAPVFDEIDALKMKITVTLFVFWAEWAHGGQSMNEWLSHATPAQSFFRPVAVPLVDPAERAFYLSLAVRGHEIGMHSASETSDTTAQTERAFAYFTQVFGHSPTVYVEHSHKNNKEALINEGADPRSPYYNLEILRRYHPWVWLNDPLGLPRPENPRYFDLFSIPGGPFNAELSRRYGLSKVFMRTGVAGQADGDGFLSWYSPANIDLLERDRGLALVYMHLDKKWLDVATQKMREPLRERLRYLAHKNGWFAPAGRILDRLLLMKNVSLHRTGKHVRIENRNPVTVDSISVISSAKAGLCGAGQVFRPSSSGDIVLGNMRSGQILDLTVCH